MSDTPRTDAVIHYEGTTAVVDAVHARALERELEISESIHADRIEEIGMALHGDQPTDNPYDIRTVEWSIYVLRKQVSIFTDALYRIRNHPRGGEYAAITASMRCIADEALKKTGT
jgi:hypothetical protein